MARITQKRRAKTGSAARKNRKTAPKNQPRLAIPQSRPDVSSSTPAISNITKDFQLFSKLPKELRLKIWGMATQDQRVVILDLDRRSSSPPPGILHACVESREVALNSYTLTFGSQRQPDRVYFNFDQDILFLRRSAKVYPGKKLRNPPVPFNLLDCNDKERVQYLGYDLSFLNDRSISLRWDDLVRWPALKGLYLALHNRRLDVNSQISFIPLPEKNYRAFSTAFFQTSHYYGLEASMPRKPLSARIEWIRAQCIRYWGNNPEGQIWYYRYKKLRETVRLVKIVNSSSLGR